MVTIKSKDGYNVDVTSLYLKAMQKQIIPHQIKIGVKVTFASLIAP